MSFCALQGLVQSDKLEEESNVRLVALFDHEEVGSQSTHGAAGTLMMEATRRITAVMASADSPADLFEVALRRSFLISADMAHAVHPNYSEKHEEHHQPAMHGGVVLKINSNQRYATNSVTALMLRTIANQHKLKLQEFVVRNDSACGTTIGPILAASIGLRTVDIGAPQLSMHSIREVCGTEDVESSLLLCKAFFEDFAVVDKTLSVDM
eukprot:TRINITY_DN3037_c0_g1_i1.p1 TRINITY_DN3037_c0_g1~~TRINITY_DN3037_c0_g1_i1.p1  ORF type:complete len:210 (-),score=50.33 TRINITY_DN3037_c0_g1_i1:24-653(-)